MQEGNEMAFQLAGGDHDPKRYQRIRDALEALDAAHQAKSTTQGHWTRCLTAAGTAKPWRLRPSLKTGRSWQ
jgi:hypothetical protein